MKINEYDYKKTFKLKKNTRFFGIELEIESKSIQELDLDYDDEAEEVEKIVEKFDPYFADKAYLKHDGSLNAGVEIVTNPITFAEQQAFWTPEKFDFLEKEGFISYSAEHAGIHIHVSKSSISALQLAKIIKFIYSKDNRPFIKKIAQREEKQYAEFSERKSCAYVKRGQGMGNKYTAVNLAPRDTVEFRLFRGTLNHRAFHKNLEFVHALIDFCSPTMYSIRETEIWWNFMNYVRLNKDKYKNLYSYCQDKQMECTDSWAIHLEEKKAKKDAIKAERQKAKADNQQVELVIPEALEAF